MDIMKMGKNPNYLGSWDLEELPGRQVVLTISDIKDEEIIDPLGKGSVCTVCYWEETDFKPMILNVTNKKRICKAYKTKETEKMKGKQVIVYIDRVKAFGDIYDALRIKQEIPKSQSSKIKCSECGEIITPSNGMTGEQIAKYTLKKYKKVMCAKCASKEKSMMGGESHDSN